MMAVFVVLVYLATAMSQYFVVVVSYLNQCIMLGSFGLLHCIKREFKQPNVLHDERLQTVIGLDRERRF